MRLCPACHERSISAFTLLTRRSTKCAKCETAVGARTDIWPAMTLALLIIGIPKVILAAPLPLQLVTLALCFAILIIVLAMSAPLVPYFSRFGRSWPTQEKGSRYVWVFIVCMLSVAILLRVLRIRYGF